MRFYIGGGLHLVSPGKIYPQYQIDIEASENQVSAIQSFVVFISQS